MNSPTMNTFQKGADPDHPLEYPLQVVPKTGRIVNPTAGRNVYKVPEPTPTDSELFALQMEDVLKVRSGPGWPEWLFDWYGIHPRPSSILQNLLDRKDNFDSAAAMVRMDSPFELAQHCCAYANMLGVPLKSTPDQHINFVGRNVDPLAIASEAISRAPSAFFPVKYFFGVIRPEEWFGFNCTAYPEGCPKHPSDVAGHGTFAGATAYAIFSAYAFGESDSAFSAWREIIETCVHWACYRTLAGVHRMEENLRGFVLGWACGGKTSYAKAFAELLPFFPAWAEIHSVAPGLELP